MFKKRQILSPAITEHQGLLGAKDRNNWNMPSHSVEPDWEQQQNIWRS
jgi:hypothetical protein